MHALSANKVLSRKLEGLVAGFVAVQIEVTRPELQRDKLINAEFL